MYFAGVDPLKDVITDDTEPQRIYIGERFFRATKMTAPKYHANREGR